MLSIIILTLNRNEELQTLLSSIAQQQGILWKDLEVIVIDNSDENLARKVADKFKSLNIVYHGNRQNMGTSAARNIWHKLAHGDYILYLDDDNVLQEELILSRIFEDIKYTGQYIHIGAIKYINDLPYYDQWVCMGYKLSVSEIPAKLTQYIDENTRTEVGYLYINHFATCGVLLSKKILQEIWGFDEHIFYRWEDMELSSRMLKNGYDLLLNTRVKIRHMETPKNRLVFKNEQEYTKNHFLNLYKNYPLPLMCVFMVNWLLVQPYLSYRHYKPQFVHVQFSQFFQTYLHGAFDFFRMIFSFHIKRDAMSWRIWWRSRIDIVRLDKEIMDQANIIH